MTDVILKHLGLAREKPTLAFLQKLITAYCATVPWESVSRIIRKNKFSEPKNCMISETDFWNESIQTGTGGTCYESNYAFNFLLNALGFETYLTINKVADKSSLHSAIIVIIDSAKYIADIGYPLYAAIPITKYQTEFTGTTAVQYRSVCMSAGEYVIENYPHPKPYLYHLTDKPVTATDYLQICEDDYGVNGLFLDRIVIRKVVQGIPARFDSGDLPYNIHQLRNGEKTRSFFRPENIIDVLSGFYNIYPELIRKCFELV